MTPLEQAAAVYLREPCKGSFYSDIRAHQFTGYVIDEPDFFAMGRPVPRCADESLILDPWHAFELAECDAWLVWLVAGDAAKAWQAFPYPLPWVGYERENKLRWKEWARLARIAA
jgi:hypothetical protein